eukprot:jgi/Chlat1/5373/Chrsp35S00397
MTRPELEDRRGQDNLPERNVRPRVGSSPQKDEPDITEAPKMRYILDLPEFPTRPQGTQVDRRPVRVLANMFAIKCQLTEAYKYDVKVVSGLGRELRPRDKKANVNEGLGLLLADKFRHAVAFDGRAVAISPKRLTSEDGTAVNELELDIQVPGRHFPLRVILKLAETLAFPSPSMQYERTSLAAIDMFVRHKFASNNYINRNRTVFNKDVAGESLGGGVRLLLGHRQAVLQTDNGLALSLDFTALAVYDSMRIAAEKPEESYVHTKSVKPGTKSLNDTTIRVLERELKNLEVVTIHLPRRQRRFTVKKITREPATELKGWLEGALEVSVAQYFDRQYGALTYPEFPCLEVTEKVFPRRSPKPTGKENADQAGSSKQPEDSPHDKSDDKPRTKPEKKTLYFPIELLRIVEGQPLKKGHVLAGFQTKKMLELTSVRPEERVRINERMIPDVVADFKINIDSAMTQATGYELPPVKLVYGSRSGRPNLVDAHGGEWRTGNVGFQKPAALAHWAVLCYDRSLKEHEVNNFVKQLIQCCQSANMDVADPASVGPGGSNVRSDLENCLSDIVAKTFKGEPVHQPLVVLILPGQRDDNQFRPESVKAADAGVGFGAESHGLLVMHVLSITARKTQRASMLNIIGKLNAKLEGTNCAPQRYIWAPVPGVDPEPLMPAPTLVMGAAVGGSEARVQTRVNVPTIAALVAGIDPYGFRYAATRRLNTPKDRAEGEAQLPYRIIQCLDEMVEKALEQFCEASVAQLNDPRGLVPRHLILYRDGVSEGEFNYIVNYEWPLILKACAKFTVAIQKSLDGPQDAFGDISHCFDKKGNYRPKITLVVLQKGHNTRLFNENNQNVSPGIVVDAGIVHFGRWEFFLNSHKFLKGTNRTSLYVVLKDENNLSGGQLQEITNVLCQTYAKCPRSISKCVPVYYASQVAKRARYFLSDASFSDAASTHSSEHGQGRQQLPVPHLEIPDLHPELANRMYFV